MTDPSEPLVYVHGLFMNGWEALLLRRRLAGQGFDSASFGYRATADPIGEVARRLEDFILGLRAPRVHLVGHSLGGLVILRLVERFSELPPGRVVFLGTPGVRCAAALAASRHAWVRRRLGCACDELCSLEARRWRSARDLGILAGTRGLGLGRFFAHFDEPSDGTVAVSETRLPGARDHRTIAASHMGLLADARAARETAHFLRHGRFTGSG